MNMIKNFVFILHNGIRTPPGVFLTDVPLLQQINDPDFHPKTYEWESDGKIFTRPIDGCETLTAHLLPDGSRIAVLQNENTYGPDNVAILDATNGLCQRITNPYRNSRFFVAGDRFWFDSISINQGEIILHIQVHRELPGKPYDFTPSYMATYKPALLKLIQLEWRPQT
ncbi:hypothetical protein PY254_16480 [Rhodanobacter sp. AS-Z3]|uniref:hypothetical protein n=1 Tax=Rhodanobacter sp. AS-Z3 TaxID=3031330 RepID=UPI0024796E78|nr:hypothetical protein [Rhodanobacter sp. AS-Z3]WEN14807.1 hypothetical protein PY254_16480 [Rhodanobacter sp. AS-Z3]